MKKAPIIAILLLIPALSLVGIVGCNNKTIAPDAGKEKEKAKDKGDNKDLVAIASGDGVLKGVVKLKGDAPAPKPEAGIAGHKEKAECMAGGGKHVLEQTWLVKDGLVENVVVYLEAPEGKKYKIDDKVRDSFKKKTVTLDQPFCAYVPHVVAVYADVQPFVVKNSASIPHNTKIVGGARNSETNDLIPPGKSVNMDPFKREGVPLTAQCSIHAWMNAKILTFDHPYFAVTKEDGAFEIANLPVGEPLTIYMWHESTGKKQDMGKITLKAGETKTNDLEISK